MLNFFLSVLTIALIMGLTFAGYSYLNTDLPPRINAKLKASAGIISLSQAFSAYKIANRGALPTFQSDSSLPMADLSAYLPAAPSTPLGLIWTYGSNPDGPVICLYGGSVSQPILQGLEDTQAANPSSFLAQSCDAPAAATPQPNGAAALVLLIQ